MKHALPFESCQESFSGEVAAVDQLRQVQSFWGKYVWDTIDLPPSERKLLFKLDTSLLVFASLGYFVKNLDTANLNTAFVSGMKEDLSLYGNQLVHAASTFITGYIVGAIPANLALTRISPRYVIPGLELLWGIFTLATYRVNDYKTLYVFRFFVGLCEAGFYPGVMYILGSFYTPRELAKRSGIFWVSGSLGTMFSGFLQTAAYKNLNGVGGLAGWRWLFIIDAMITIPIALLGFLFLPNMPWDAKPNFVFTTADLQLAQDRMKMVGRKGKQPWTKAKVVRLFDSWHIWVLPIYYGIWNTSMPVQPMAYWLKSFNSKPAPVPGVTYTVSQINLLPLPATAVLVVAVLTVAWLSDGLMKGVRWPFIAFSTFIALAVDTTLLKLPVYAHRKAHFALYYMLQLGSAGGTLIPTWTAELTGHDTEARAIIMALGNDFAFIFNAVAPNFVWKTTDFPAARKGFRWSISLTVLTFFMTFVVVYFERYQRRRALKENENEDKKFGTSVGSSLKSVT